MYEYDYSALNNVGTVNELAPLRGVSRQTLINWCLRGYIHYRKSGKVYLIDIQSLDEFMREDSNYDNQSG